MPEESTFYVVSLKHTKRRDRYITVWRPDDKGYCYPLPWAGFYPESRIRQSLDYYNNGCTDVAVPCGVLDQIAIPPMPGEIDNDAGPMVPNNAESWCRILANTIETPAYEPRPEYKGAHYRKTT
ncbi:hypothetical protein ACFSKY_22745 [Azotobacter chroococcum]|uniref:Uncharacterized protein n=1 Tax=Azotobacter chroococcum TaxID=353 RepID=A0A4R1PMX5_9GAMM|nr:hypothetical protein [Azotobacter chroococcum]TBV90491.1 hypothetical protein E0E53_23440 [Azotobacter chroococcum]TCL32017.1 hypothetical protein EV691_10911 [Azotobacter chroococcum]